MGNVVNRISSITDHPTALKIGADVENGMQLSGILEKYGRTPKLKAEISEIAAKIESALRNGKPVNSVLDAYIEHEEVRSHLKKHVAEIHSKRKGY